MKTKFISIILLGASLGLGSCSDYLDMTPTDKASDKLVWSKLEYAEQAVNDFYRYIDYLGVYRDGQCLAGMTEALTDQLKYGSYNYMSKCQIPSEIAYGGSVLTVSYVSTYLGNWGTMYEYVRRVNEGLNKLKKYASFGQTEQERLEAEMRFFRGYLYTDLVKRYKEVIIYDEDLDNIKKDMPVSSEAEGWNFVYEDLKFAGEHLPVDKTPNGRLTSGAAYAMLSRAMLYAERWDDARIAAEEVMGMGYKLEEKENYSNAFKAGSQEAILQYCYDKSSTVTHDFDGYMAPGGDKALDGNSMTGGFGTPTQEMVESYEYADGSGFPDWVPGILQKEQRQLLHTINLNHASKQPFFIMVRRGKAERSHLMSMVLMVGLHGKRMPNQKDVLPQVIICVSWWMRLIVSLLCRQVHSHGPKFVMPKCY